MRATNAAEQIAAEDILLPYRPGLASQSWDDDEVLLACGHPPLTSPPLAMHTVPTSSLPSHMPSLYDLLPPQELMWTAPAWQPTGRPFDATTSQPSLPTVRSFPSLASRQRTSLEDSALYWDDYVRGGSIIRSRSLRIDPPFLNEVPTTMRPPAPPYFQQQQQVALLDMLAAQPGGSVPLRPSIVTNTRLREVFLSTAEVEDLQRQESSLLAGSHPPAPAPPPTPVHSTLVGNVFGTDVNAAVDCMDVVIEEDTGPYTFAMPTSNDMMLGAEPSTSGAHPLGLPPLPPLTVNTVGGHAGDHGTASSPTAEMAAASRARCLERLRHKKLHRRFGNHHVRYEQRKVNADRRPRVKGRFVKAAPDGAAPDGAPDGPPPGD